MDPGLAIVLTVFILVAGMGAAAFVYRRRLRARFERAKRVSVPIPSKARGAVAVLTPVLAYAAVLVAVGVATGGAKEHALWMVCSFMVVTTLSFALLAHPWTQAGALVLDETRSVLELQDRGGDRPALSIALDRPFELEADLGLGSRGAPVVNIGIVQDGARIDYHYMYPLTPKPGLPEGPPNAAPRGVALGLGGEILHARLRQHAA